MSSLKLSLIVIILLICIFIIESYELKLFSTHVYNAEFLIPRHAEKSSKKSLKTDQLRDKIFHLRDVHLEDVHGFITR